MSLRSWRTPRMSPAFLVLFVLTWVFFLINPCAVKADIGHRSTPLRDYPAIGEIKVTGGRVVDGNAVRSLGHLPGKWAYIRTRIEGQDRSTTKVTWTVRPSGSGPIQVTVEARTPKAGSDRKTIVIDQ
jgi:hypothetical protein